MRAEDLGVDWTGFQQSDRKSDRLGFDVHVSSQVQLKRCRMLVGSRYHEPHRRVNLFRDVDHGPQRTALLWRTLAC